jgi:hypothetical protein
MIALKLLDVSFRNARLTAEGRGCVKTQCNAGCDDRSGFASLVRKDADAVGPFEFDHDQLRSLIDPLRIIQEGEDARVGGPSKDSMAPWSCALASRPKALPRGRKFAFEIKRPINQTATSGRLAPAVPTLR